MRFLLLALVAFPILAHALRFQEVELVCPVGGERFRTTEAMSGTSFGRYLDQKPYGPIAAPWPLAKCPSNGFVMYQSGFSKSEIDLLSEYVVSSEYRELLRSDHTNYYLAAALKRHLGLPTRIIAFTLLQATWEAGRSQYARYASEALDAYKELLWEKYADKKQWVSDQLIAGELERRLGKFEDARTRFSELNEKLSDEDPIQEIIEFQLELVSAKDSEPQLIRQRTRPATKPQKMK